MSGGACHAGSDAKAGLRMDEIEEAYNLLINGGRVVAGDASCSLMVVRMEGGGQVMPPGGMLSESERCAVETWIAQGANR